MSKQQNNSSEPRVAVEAPLSKSVKIGLIRKFQLAEGNFDCCASTSSYVRVCNQFGCLWRDECLESLLE